MADIITGRQTATVDDGVVVFLIGMRINRWRRVRSWLPAFRAMPRMLQELAADPSLGMLGAHSFWAGRTIIAVQYWRSYFDTDGPVRKLESALDSIAQADLIAEHPGLVRHLVRGIDR